MLRLCLVLLFIILSLSGNAQQISEISAHKVYDQIIDAIGNNNPRSPKLVFKDSERNPASYSPKKKIITIENKVLEICHSFGEDSLNALSYILAHELGHHYRNHGWMSQYASLEFSDALDGQNKTPEQREKRLAYLREYRRKRAENETPEERAERLAEHSRKCKKYYRENRS